MDKLVIRGGNPLLGTVRISGAKNAALPCMAAALLTDEPVILENIPQVHDIETTRKLLAAMGAEIVFDKITGTGTEDLLMAATLADGETVMQNCACEPEVADLAALLNAMGAKIQGAGTSTIRVKGVTKLHGARHRIIPDRIEAGTFILAGALTRGDLNVAGCDPAHLTAILQKLAKTAVKP